MWPENPKIYLLENFIPVELANEMIAIAKHKLQVSKIYGDADGSGVNRKVRNNMLCWVDHDHNETTLKICRDIAGEVGLPLSNAEPIQVNNYKTGQYYQPHYDALALPEQSGKPGPRLVTALVYLNTVKKGGETVFNRLGYKQPPRIGDMLIFHNTMEGTLMRDLNSMHGSEKVLDGEKWAMNLWFRQNRYSNR